MIEFTLSRVVLMVAGVALLAVVAAAFAGTDERVGEDLDSDAAREAADILDRFEASILETYVLEPEDVLPTADHILAVSDHVVRLECDGRVSLAVTEYGGSFTMTWLSGSVTLEKSVSEGLGDAPDGVGEDVDLGECVVQIGGGTGAPVYPP